jgi:predicted CXXCH cytochrome family protein
MMRIKEKLLILLGFIAVLAYHNLAFAVIDGPCVDCHTMHNSQDGTSMNFDNSATPNEILLRADCFGCHARGINQNIDPSNGAPQVLHNDATDLAAGNFAYITGFGGKSRITADQNSAGHNVIDLGATYKETVLSSAPPDTHPNSTFTDVFTCAGRYGCHGFRPTVGSCAGLPCIKGSHHQNVDGKIDTATEDYNSYRFLRGVKGLEDSDWQASTGPTDHNEYFGANTPISGVDCGNCKATIHSSAYLRPLNNTISGFCGTCHKDFHFLEGIGGNTSSPFKRHPTDVVLKGSGEYASYTSYSLEAPVARPTVYDTPSSTVNPGTDVVMCLSCHSPHATPYADILRWDYTTMIAGGSGTGGCFTCHTKKN